MRRSVFVALAFLWGSSLAFAQGNGKLQIHFLSVGQGDAAILVSPLGETVLFDNGPNRCDRPVAYLQELGVIKIDYHIASHYHSDHIGCTPQVLAAFPLQVAAIDRGGTYTTVTYNRYAEAVEAFRRTATAGETITLDAGSPNPVSIDIVALNGNGLPARDENDLSVVARVRFGSFDAEMGGDLGGFTVGVYRDIETSVAPLVGQVEVYKVHHHGSRNSSNEAWLDVIRPRVGIISVGEGNRYGHPAPDSMDRLHAAGVRTYWTSSGGGAVPDPELDVVAGTVIVETEPGAATFTVRDTTWTQVDTYTVWDAAAAPVEWVAWSEVAADDWSRYFNQREPSEALLVLGAAPHSRRGFPPFLPPLPAAR